MPKIIFYCYDGGIPSALVAEVYINKTSLKDLELKKYVKKTPDLFYIGIDNEGNKVFSMGMKKSADIIERAARGILEIFKKEENCDLKFVNTLGIMNWEITIGKLLITMGLNSLGLNLIKSGVINSWCKIEKLAKE